MNVFIDGIGMISRCVQTADELADIVMGNAPRIQQMPVMWDSTIPAAKLRRNSRYNKLACEAADRALKDSEALSLCDGQNIGTIVSTGYGAAEYSSVFADSVVKGVPEACSPSVFAGSVPNSCLGQICILNGLKGPSTVLAGGDPLEYASLLLASDRAERILAGSVEEYFAPLYSSVMSFEAARGMTLSEGSAMVVLSPYKSAHTYCRIDGFSGVCLGADPYIHRVKGSQEMIAGALEQMKRPDAVFIAANGTWLDEHENNAVKQVFPDIHTVAPKIFFGETLGCGYMMNIAFAAAAVKCGLYKSVIAAGVDMIGNYTCVLLQCA